MITCNSQRQTARAPFMVSGAVVFFNHEKGYGFVKNLSGGPHIYCHITALENVWDAQRLKYGTRVKFDVEEGPRGAFAKNVTFVDKK
eukprot:g2237.t1